jgi:hypothetical protein
VEAGFGRVKEKTARSAEFYVPQLFQTLMDLQRDAQQARLGIYQACDGSGDGNKQEQQQQSKMENIAIAPTAEFETLQPELPTVVPPNPGDRRNCADFDTYEDALRYYEAFFPYYGDVARLDRDNDGVPCPGLPHTSDRDLYRMKVPRKNQQR